MESEEKSPLQDIPMDPLSITGSVLAIVGAGEIFVDGVRAIRKRADVETKRLAVLELIATVRKAVEGLQSIRTTTNDFQLRRQALGGRASEITDQHKLEEILCDIGAFLSSLEDSLSPYSLKPKNMIRELGAIFQQNETELRVHKLLQSAATQLEIKLIPLRIQSM